MNPLIGNWAFIILSLVNCLAWAAKGNGPQALYWFASALINVAVVWGVQV